MPELERGPRTYAHNQMEQPLGFQLNGAGAPTVLRDGTNVASAKKIFTVVRTSIGLYTVSLDNKSVWPVFPFIYAQLEQAAAPTAPCTAKYVVNSYNAVARTFQIQVQTIGTTPAASDADAGNRITCLIKGGTDSVGQDPA